MLVIADALDQLLDIVAAPPANVDPWGAWGRDAPPLPAFAYPPSPVMQGVLPRDGNVEVRQGEDTTEIIFAPPTIVKREARAMFERQQLNLADSLPTGEDYARAYELGGPLWLYHGNRELFMTYPYETRQAMVADVEDDDPAAAREMARDVLKGPCEVGGVGGGGMRTADEYEGGVR
jgi:hypothetical protein